MFSIFLSLSIVSCKKAQINPSASSIDGNVETSTEENQRMMVFKTSDQYEQLINKSSEEKQIELEKIRNQKFVSVFEKNQKSKTSIDEINDEFLSSILNEDNVVQIGNFIYKLNSAEEKVYVLSSFFSSEYSDLVKENTINKHIRKFSTADNVIELAESGADGEKALFCNENGVGSSTSYVYQTDMNNVNNIKSTLSHNKYGIYFTLVFESYSNWALSNFTFEFSSNSGERCFKRTCESMEYVAVSSSSLKSVSGYKYKFKESIKNFNKYNIRARCLYYVNDLSMTSNHLISTSNWVQIRVNM